ncbi:YegP family protein [Halococcus morrhuae DSM 1307]|uniref:YegP family protein n=1 Tax=Halococcus morrhuae TaxID=2250 RepID=UPI003F855F13
MSDHDHEYTLAVRPNATVQLAYSTDDGKLADAFLAVEYGREGIDGDDATAEGIAWRGYEIALARDGEAVLGENVEAALDRGVDRVLDGERALTDDDRFQRAVSVASAYGQRAKAGLAGLRGREETALDAELPETVELSGPGGTTIDVSLSETAAAFDLYEDDGGNWRWRLVHDDETLAVSPSGYDSRDDAEATITTIKENVLGAEIEE